jgi:hypothetical protein
LDYVYFEEDDIWEVKIPSRYGSELVLQAGSTVVFEVRQKTAKEKDDDVFDLDDVQWEHVHKESTMRAYLRDGMISIRHRTPQLVKKLKRKSKKYEYDCETGNLLFVG